MKKKNVIIISIVAVVLVVGAVLAFLLWPRKSNKEVYADAIKESFNVSKLVKSVGGEDVANALAEHIVKLTIEGKGELADEKMEIYAGKNQFYGLLSGKENGTEFNAIGLLKDEKFYFTIKDVLSKYYYIDESEMNVDLDNESDAVSAKLLEYFVESFFDQIDNKNVKKESEELKINGNTYKTERYANTFTGSDMQGVVESFVKKVKEDKDLCKELEKLLANMGSDEKIDLNEGFDEIVKESASLKDLGNLFTYSVYLYKGEVISTSITANIPSGEQQVPVSLVFNNVTDGGKTYAEAYLGVMGQKYISVVLKQTSETNTDLSVTVMNQEYVSGKITKDGKNLVVKIEGNKQVGLDFTLEMNLNVVDDLNMTGNVKLTSGGESVEFNIKSEEVDKVPEADVSNSAPASEMTEEDQNALEKLFGGTKSVTYWDDDEWTQSYDDDDWANEW